MLHLPKLTSAQRYALLVIYCNGGVMSIPEKAVFGINIRTIAALTEKKLLSFRMSSQTKEGRAVWAIDYLAPLDEIQQLVEQDEYLRNRHPYARFNTWRKSVSNRCWNLAFGLAMEADPRG